MRIIISDKELTEIVESYIKNIVRLPNRTYPEVEIVVKTMDGYTEAEVDLELIPTNKGANDETK